MSEDWRFVVTRCVIVMTVEVLNLSDTAERTCQKLEKLRISKEFEEI